MRPNINKACKQIRDHWDEIKRDFFAVVPGHYLEVTCVYRSPAEQFELFKQGRKQDESGNWIVVDRGAVVTNVDGVTVLGAHNYLPARAIDVCVVDNQTGTRLWDIGWYKPLIEIAARYGLEDGGSWRSIKDWPHLQVRDFKNYNEA